MQVKTVAMKMVVTIEKVNASDDSVVLHGMAGTRPCETIIGSAEALKIFRMCFKLSILTLLLKTMLSREKQ